MTSLLDAVRTFAEPILEPIFGRRRVPVMLRHRDTGILLGPAQDGAAVAFDDADDALHFLDRHACEPEAWEAIPLAS